MVKKIKAFPLRANEGFWAKVSGNMKYALMRMMMTMKIMIGMVAALRNSCGLIVLQLLGDGLMTQMENDDGQWI